MPAIPLQSTLGFELHNRRRITAVLVGVDDPRRRMVLSAQQLDRDCDLVPLVVDFGLNELYRPCSTGPNATHRVSFSEKRMRREQTSASIFLQEAERLDWVFRPTQGPKATRIPTRSNGAWRSSTA
jgi:hypothetical protein